MPACTSLVWFRLDCRKPHCIHSPCLAHYTLPLFELPNLMPAPRLATTPNFDFPLRANCFCGRFARVCRDGLITGILRCLAGLAQRIRLLLRLLCKQVSACTSLHGNAAMRQFFLTCELAQTWMSIRLKPAVESQPSSVTLACTSISQPFSFRAASAPVHTDAAGYMINSMRCSYHLQRRRRPRTCESVFQHLSSSASAFRWRHPAS